MFYKVSSTMIRFYNMIFKLLNKEETPNKSLPIELQIMILLKLPVKSLVRFKCVSKNWLTEITSKTFINLYNHENYPQNHDSNHRYLILVGSSSISSFDYSTGRDMVSNFALPREFQEELNSKFVGSCNGLLCFVSLTSGKILLYNPITKANRVIRISGFTPSYKEYETGFGYDHMSNDYKILWVSRKKIAYILRLRSNKCKKIKYTPTTRFAWHFGSFQKEKPSMVYSNNALHWVGQGTQGSPGSIVYEIISCFDIGSEKFYELRTPRLMINTWMSSSWNIADLRGYLHCVIHCCPDRSSPHNLEIWVMKEYGVHKSWTKLINYSSVERMFSRGIDYIWSQPNVYVYSKDDREILIKFGPYSKQLLLSCNLITRKIKKVRVSLFDGDDLVDKGLKGFYVAPWSPSFVSL
ncbi:F-box/kelch-repeat protein At3g23880-like [Silene latifolia]|uniref:F-box/kelch-repeat protein At3g23880-like n=1 Tax=Silene latifolia TaxID=37657 RepID=UPI003D784E22